MKTTLEQLKAEAAQLPPAKAHRIALKIQTIEQILAEPEPAPSPEPAPKPPTS